MSTRFYLKDIQGDNPKISFNKVMAGAQEMYEPALHYIRGWIPKSDAKLDFNDSKFKTCVELLQDYVCNNKFTVTSDAYEWKDCKPTDVIDELFEAVDSIYTLWSWGIRSISTGALTDHISDELRYFSLFAQAAWLRLQVDYNCFGEFRPRGENYTETYFTREDLALLTSITIHKTDIQKTYRDFKIDYDFPTTTLKLQATHLPDHPEFDHYEKGRKAAHAPLVITHSDATDWLTKNSKLYKNTKFTYQQPNLEN